jgi:PKD repeat protein
MYGIITGKPSRAPMANPGVPYTGNEGEPIAFDASESTHGYPNSAIVSYEWNFGDGTTSTGVNPSHTFTDNGEYTATLKVTDNNVPARTDSKTVAVTVNNVPPTATLNTPASVNEGSAITLSLTNPSDPSGADTAAGLLYAFDCGTGYGEYGSVSTASCPTTDNGARIVKARIKDKDGGETEYTASVTINNVAPVITSTTGPSDPLALSSSASVTASFTDAGSLDIHTCTISWDDGTSSPGTVTESGGSGSCTASRTYTASGVYTVGITVSDDDAASAVSKFEYVVVYDPGAGFVTGGGWINSPAGAYAADLTMTGRANFGFVSKYQKGANIPTGQTEFQFKAGNLNFHSTIYDWLVVAGAKAQYKGSGTINGAGDYGFLLTATDGQVSGGEGVDKFRIKIMDKAAETVVYDNVNGVSDDIDAANPQAIGGGSIVIHK